LSLYSQVFEAALLPFYDVVNGRKYARHRTFLEQSQWWPAERLRDFQWQELQRLLKHAFETVPYYRRKYAAAGISADDVRDWDDFRNLPTLTREEVDTYRQELCSTGYSGRLLPEATGGSSGVPTRFFITLESYDWRSAASQRAMAWSGILLGERTLCLWGGPIRPQTAWQLNKERLYHWLRRELLVNTFRQTDQFWEQTWRQAAAFRPRFIVGYVSSLDAFLRYGQIHGKRLPEVRAVFAIAEPVYDSLRQLVKETLNVPLFSNYGSREFMSIAAECEVHQGLHVNAENILLETKNRATEGPSEFLVTDLHNYGMPFIRYEIGDIGALDLKPCTCGRGLPKIHSIEGRTLDVLRGKDSRMVPGEFFPHLLKEITEISEFQVEQKSLDHIILWVVLKGPLSEESQELLKNQVIQVFGDCTRLEIRQVPSIPLRASGKRRVTIGLGSPNLR
jgi:phenylacetate-CoA ligase